MEYFEWKLYERELGLNRRALRCESEKADDELLREERLKNREDLKECVEACERHLGKKD